MLSAEALLRISKEVGAPVSRVEAVIALLEGGATIPFIARYRKDPAGNLDETKLADIDDRRVYYSNLEERRKSVLSSIEKQGKLTDELRQKILACFSRNELEDFYLPFKPKRKTKASAALEMGLGPLADHIWAQTGTEPVETYAAQFVSAPEPAPAEAAPATPPSKRAASVEEAVEGALYILAERIAEIPEFRKQLRDALLRDGVVRARVVEGKESEKTKYEMYYKFEETVPKIPSHRMLAIRRGARENVLTYSIEIDNEKFMAALLPQIVRDAASPFAPLLERAARDGYTRLMAPSIQTEVRSMLRERAESDAIKVFQENLRTLLLAPPAGLIAILGVDPGSKAGCRLAVVDASGSFVESQTISLAEPQTDAEGAEKTLVDLIQKHSVRGIAVGNGTGSREAESFVRSVVQKHGLDVFIAVVSEAGASVYSSSKRAREEFPSLDAAARSAISIARRLQDPLAELVKIEPRSVGVGQYQHDVDQKKLKRSLARAVEASVNRVGVDLNAASADLLKYVSGIHEKLESELVARRTAHGAFRSRTELREIEGFDEKRFEQAAGFLRIKGGDNVLDGTAVHPESYPLVERMAASVGVSVPELVENSERIASIDFKSFEAEADRFTVSDIREELLKPGRDPRGKFVAPKFRADVQQTSDLKEGMELEGSVTNVTNFGAFVDLGVEQDGLVHISELSHRYIQDAREAVKVGDVVKVKVIGIDSTMKRISLSMKAVLPKPRRRPRRKKRAAAPAGPRIAPQTPPVVVPAASAGSGGDAAPAAVPANARAASPNSQNRPPKPPKPPKPVIDKTPPPPVAKQSMEEKIRLLQEKFGRVG